MNGSPTLNTGSPQPTDDKIARVLIVEDSITFQALHEGYLRDGGYDAISVSSGEAALQTLEVHEFDIILMDVTMPGLDGFETAQLIREQYPERWIPIIFIAGNDEDEHFQKAIESGGDDYLIKPVREVALISKVKAICRILRMQDSLKAAHQELQHRSRTDVLTGLYTRRTVLDEANAQWQLLTRLRHPLAVLLFDIDHFKAYNDHYGHHGGDQCLTYVADVLRESFTRDTDLVGRLGGEEFLVVLPNTTTSMAKELAEAFQRKLAMEGFEHAAAPRKTLTVSIGCAACHSLQDHDLEGLIQHADDLLYEAKAKGRDCVCWDDYPTSHKLLTDLEHESDRRWFNPLQWWQSLSLAAAIKLTSAAIVLMLGVVVTLVLMKDSQQTQKSTEIPTTHHLAQVPETLSSSSKSLQPVVTATKQTDAAPESSNDASVIKSIETTAVAEGQIVDSDAEPTVPAMAKPVTPLDNIEPEGTTTAEAATEMAAASSAELNIPTEHEQVAARIEQWRLAWQNQSAAMFDYYHVEFVSNAGTPLAAWQPVRLATITKPDWIQVIIENLETQRDDDLITATFVQHYQSNSLSDKGIKTLILKQNDEQQWAIVQERFKAL